MHARIMSFVMAALALVAPASGLADNFIMSDPTGQLRIQVSSPKGNVDEITPITMGNVEIAAGLNSADGAYKRFALTRVILHFADFSGESLSLINIGAHNRDTMAWWGRQIQPGVYEILIPPKPSDEPWGDDGEPVFTCTAQGDEIYYGDEQVSEPISGVIDLNAGGLVMHAVFKKKQKISLPLAPDLEVVSTIRVGLSGRFTAK